MKQCQGCAMGQDLGRLARSRRVQLTPIPQVNGKHLSAAEQECMPGATPGVNNVRLGGVKRGCADKMNPR